MMTEPFASYSIPGLQATISLVIHNVLWVHSWWWKVNGIEIVLSAVSFVIIVAKDTAAMVVEDMLMLIAVHSQW